MKRKQEYFENFEPFREEEVFENQIEFEEVKPKVARVMRRQNIASLPGGNKLGTHEPGEIKILEEKDGWVRVDRGWLEKCYLKIE